MTGTRAVVLELIDERVTPDSPWCGRRELRDEARKDDAPLTVEAFDATYADLRADAEIVTWHGLTTLAEEPYLTAALEAEVAADWPRPPLVARLNQVKAGSFEPPWAEA